MNDIFKTLKMQENKQFRQMTGSELQDFLQDLRHFYLSYRDYLLVKEDVTFGLEIECDKLNMAKVRDLLKQAKLYDLNNKNNWVVDTDLSLKKGGEVISPILTNSTQSWQALVKVCTILQRWAKLKNNAGGHIHIGAQVFGKDSISFWHFLKLWMIYENIIYRFSYGEYLTERPKLINFAEPISNLINGEFNYWEKLVNEISLEEFLEDVCEVLHRANYKRSSRNEAINLNNIKSFTEPQRMNTIEFRCPNATLNPIIWQNNVNLFINMLLSGSSSLYNEEIILERKDKLKKIYGDLYWYKEIFLDQALEFCDLVFNNNLDKIYFLKQYLKNCETSNKTLKKVRNFTYYKK